MTVQFGEKVIFVRHWIDIFRLEFVRSTRWLIRQTGRRKTGIKGVVSTKCFKSLTVIILVHLDQPLQTVDVDNDLMRLLSAWLLVEGRIACVSWRSWRRRKEWWASGNNWLTSCFFDSMFVGLQMFEMIVHCSTNVFYTHQSICLITSIRSHSPRDVAGREHQLEIVANWYDHSSIVSLILIGKRNPCTTCFLQADKRCICFWIWFNWKISS